MTCEPQQTFLMTPAHYKTPFSDSSTWKKAIYSITGTEIQIFPVEKEPLPALVMWFIKVNLCVNIQDMSIIPFQNFWLRGLDPSWSIISFEYSIHGILEYPGNGGKITDKTEVLMTLCGKVDQANVFWNPPLLKRNVAGRVFLKSSNPYGRARKSWCTNHMNTCIRTSHVGLVEGSSPSRHNMASKTIQHDMHTYKNPDAT